jgi:hypothetical protein
VDDVFGRDDGMITVGVIRNGATYLSHHLRKNDYWSEGEKEVRGEWIGEGARALGLTGLVTDKPFEARRRLAQQEARKLSATFKPQYESMLRYVSEKRFTP